MSSKSSGITSAPDCWPFFLLFGILQRVKYLIRAEL
jgi:hypothetical protein